MVQKACIQDNYLSPDEMLEVYRFLLHRGYLVETFSARTSVIDELPLDPDVFVFAALWIMLRLVSRSGLVDCLIPSYPMALRDMLHRTVWEGSLGELVGGPASKQRPLFVKTHSVVQRTQPGRFASQLVDSLDVLKSSPLVRPDTFILCSEPVEWVSEWRVYACNGKILDILLYWPDLPNPNAARPEMLIDLDFAEQAVSRISASDMSIAGYCLDIGVLTTGQTALVELNDGIALANYGLSPAKHAELHLNRWSELMSQIAR